MLDMFSLPWVLALLRPEGETAVEGGVHVILTSCARISCERRSLRIQAELLTGFD
jgi:hypothetical protein